MLQCSHFVCLLCTNHQCTVEIALIKTKFSFEKASAIIHESNTRSHYVTLTFDFVNTTDTVAKNPELSAKSKVKTE